MNNLHYNLIIRAIRFSLPAIADELCMSVNELVNEHNELKKTKAETETETKEKTKKEA